jgi:hypothetical protein
MAAASAYNHHWCPDAAQRRCGGLRAPLRCGYAAMDAQCKMILQNLRMDIPVQTKFNMPQSAHAKLVFPDMGPSPVLAPERKLSGVLDDEGATQVERKL